ncbi:MAG: hypothetical protein LBI06_00620, partial [Treponema sp.]|nr:hypothetical protein [Treponema sp.]
MKKVFLTALFFATGIVCYAQEDAVDIDAMIKEGLNKNFDSIQQEAADLDDEERLEIYDRHKMNVRTGLFNLIPYAGVGSWIQGDKLGASFIIAGQVAGPVIAGIGLYMYLMPIIMIFPLFTPEGPQIMEAGLYTMAAGGIILGVSYLFGILRGF